MTQDVPDLKQQTSKKITNFEGTGSGKETEPIAIIGIGCRFPGNANSPEAFWKLLLSSVDAISEVPESRWNVNYFYDPDIAKSGKIRTRWGGFVDKIDEFDAQFFGISPREASRMDPQQRLMLEVAQEALEDAGQMSERLADSKTAVFIGISGSDYQNIQGSDRDSMNAYTNLGGVNCITANRISYVFDLKGPSMTVDTACSSSLVAVHLACQSIWNGESVLSIAGGVNAILKPEVTIGFSQASMLSPDGRCFTFDARANGYVRAEGAGIVVLKPLSQAQADRDPIYAVILSSAVNQDGQTNGITVPSGQSQEAALQEACLKAGISPEQIQYIEAHGTGTPVGDPIEAIALGNVLGKNRPPGDYCTVGSVKTNIGHLETASGIAGLIKVALALKHCQIPPNLHFQTPNPKIPFEELGLRVPTTLEPWRNENGSRIAGVNSFGFGGTNAHVLLSGLATDAVTDIGDSEHGSVSVLLPLSAKSPEALVAVARATHEFLTALDLSAGVSLTDICYTASLRRDHHDHRLALVADTKENLVENLEAFLAGENRPGLSSGHLVPDFQPKLAFVFSGMGPQWWAMGRQLLESEPIFREVIEQCDELLRQYADWSLLSELTASEETSRINSTQIAQCSIFAVQIALAALWRDWGITPQAIVGHSVGEVAAAHVAGVLSLSDAVQVIFHRSRVQASAAGKGKMLAVELSQEEAERVLAGLEYQSCVSIAAVNSPSAITLAGDSAALSEIAKYLEQKQIFCRFLQVEVPYHSPFMEPLKADLAQSLQEIKPQKATIPLFSTVTSKLVEGSELDGIYWGLNMREPVLFAAAIAQLIQARFNTFVEISAHPVLANSISECLALAEISGTVLPTLRRKEPERATMLSSFGKLYTLGYPVDWHQIYPQQGRFVRLPSYPWQRERCWHESEESMGVRIGTIPQRSMLGQQVHPLLGSRLKSSQPIWDASIDKHRLSYLNDHRVQGAVVYPGAAYVEMALAAAKETFKDGAYIIEEIEFKKAFFLPESSASIVQLSLEPSQTSFEINSNVKGAQSDWVRHATGKLTRVENGFVSKQVVLDEIRRRCPNEISKSDLYRQFQEIGLEYGPSFQGIEQLWSGEGEALAQIQISNALQTEVEEYQLHPAILDACFQVSLATVDSVKGTYLPVQIEQVRVYGRPKLQMWSYARLMEQTAATRPKGDIQLFDDAGNVLVEILGLVCQSLENKQESSKKVDYLHEYQWEMKDRPGQELVRPALDYLPSPVQIAQNLQSEATRLSVQLGRPHYYSQVRPQIDALCAAYILKAFKQLGWEPKLLTRISAETLAEQLGVVSQHRQLLGRLLEILAEEGVLRRFDDQWEVCRIPSVEEPIETWKALLAESSAYQAELTLLGRCGQRLAPVLLGEVEPLELIFPEGSLTTSEHLYQDSPSYRIYNLLVQKAIALALSQLPEGRTVRILEIGAGTGSLTSYVLPKLMQHRTEYVFTDITPQFTISAEQKFRDYPFVEYQILDIEADIIAQGFQPHSFDLILASDALHATRDLRQTLENVKLLLASQGMLVLLELTNDLRLSDLTFGLLKGWWLFTDVELRCKQSWIYLAQWRDLLKDVGFAEVASIADTPPETDQSLHTVILATGPKLGQKVQSSSTVPHKPENPGTWLIFADSSGVGQQLAEELKQRQEIPILIKPATVFQRLDANNFQVCPEHAEDMQQLLEAVGANQPACRGVVYLWSLDTPPSEKMTDATLESTLTDSCLGVLHLVQALAKVNWRHSPRLFLVTNSTQAVGGLKSLCVAQSPLWGLGRVINNEHPNLRCTRVDLSPASTPEEIQSLLSELMADDKEDEIALRGKERYVNRLIRLSLADFIQKPKSLVQNREPFRLEISAPGVLENLELRSYTRQEPAPGSVEIQVCATGLNFKDVAKAINLLSDASLEGTFSERSLGIECAGIVTAIGSGVEGFKIGDEVIACAPYSFSTHTTTDARAVVHKPAHLSFEEAATIAVTFLTAYYALHYLGQLREGERVLIHAAAGGVGLAAIQIAQSVGAEIFATAGSPEKREFLRSLGVQHVMDSRSLAFASQVMEITGGKGVDIVLNSLAGEAIPKTLSVLGAYGRFIEIGKRDIEQNNKLGLRPFQNNLSFFAVDLDKLLSDRPDKAGSLLGEVMQYFEAKTFHPLPHRVFPISRVVSAFRYMAQAKHIGKIVVSLQESDVTVAPSSEETVTFRPDGTYLIIGGLSGFGLAVAQWLVEGGARHLVLMSRSGASSSAAQSAVKTLESAGASVVVAKADVSQATQVADVLTDIEQFMPPLRGIIHAATIYDDALMLQLSGECFFKVMAPKVIGAWNLHTQTLNTPLDFFVNFSSIASLVGNPGQGNYAAANAFLDALAHYRYAMGLPALTINWGAIADVGFVARQGEVGELLQRHGFKLLPSQEALRVLGELLQVEAVQTIMAPMNWRQWCQVHAAGTLPRFSYLGEEEAVSEETGDRNSERETLVNALLAAKPTERQQILESHLQKQVARVLGTSPAKLDTSKPLTNLGLDSLMGVELSNRIESDLGVSVPTMKLLGGVNIAQLAAEQLGQLIPVKSTTATTSELPSQEHSVTDWNAEVVLDLTISPGTALFELSTEPSAIFITGATGFLGAFLLHELLEQTQADIYCLVRSANEHSGKIRIQKNLETYGLWNQDFSFRIIPVLGDVSQPQMGLSSEQFQKIASQIDIIYHSAALLNYVYPYERLKPINVLGTQEVLRLASQIKVKPLHYISSVAVFESSAYYRKVVTESDQLLHSKEMYLGYSQSKWVAEKLVMMARDQGLPVCIYRPSFISGHSQTGVWNTDDIVCRTIKGYIQMGCMAELDSLLDLSPVDYVSRAIVYLSRQKESLGKAFHLNNPQSIHWRQVSDFLRSFGYSIQEVSYEHWLSQLNNTMRSPQGGGFSGVSQDNPLYPLLPFFVKKWSQEQLTLTELYQQARIPKISCHQTLVALTGTDIFCPPIDDKLLNTYSSYFIRSGFLNAP
ncbi:MAG: thioester reductase domain-containing protein [Iphinoe sp. HA4291-MV1]|jgi:thioester reductase-like protein|nr:thioester reductase domain-containing protein [Iphinoe sp. HA4291-MV1]